ncbi:MAG: hypothetical protein ACRD8O_22935, partial [Bryobacteraceae bacterium]
PGGISDNLNFNIQPNAPSIFRANSAPSVLRISDSSLIGEDNPVRKGDELVIFATGLGRTSPTIDAGLPAPSEPLAVATTEPEVRLGRSRLHISYAGLTPGEVGVYQINVRVPEDVEEGDSVPLVIEQGTGSTTLQVRVKQ